MEYQITSSLTKICWLTLSPPHPPIPPKKKNTKYSYQYEIQLLPYVIKYLIVPMWYFKMTLFLENKMREVKVLRRELICD